MKIKNLIIKNKLIQLQILKSKIYKKKLVKKKIEINKIKLYFKKISHIIFEYHINNKKILFLNFPKSIEKILNLILYQTKHLSISIENWYHGAITNKKLTGKRIQDDCIKMELKNNVDLVVMLNYKDNFLINESYISHLPTILLTSDFNVFNLSHNYQVPGNFKFLEKQFINNLFLSILNSIFKKSKIKKLKIFIINKNIYFKKNKRFKYNKNKRFKYNKNVFFK